MHKAKGADVVLMHYFKRLVTHKTSGVSVGRSRRTATLHEMCAGAKFVGCQ